MSSITHNGRGGTNGAAANESLRALLDRLEVPALREQAAVVARSRIAADPREYQAELRRRWERLDVVRWDAAFDPDVAESGEEAVTAPLAASLPMAHLGNDARVGVRLHRDGTFWTFPWREPCLVRWEEGSTEWGDPTTGTIRTFVRWRFPLPIEQVRRWASVAERIADGTEDRSPRFRRVALTLAADLEHGLLHRGLEQAAAAFERGEIDADSLELAECALRTRIALEHLADEESDAALRDGLVRADSALRSYDRALLVLPSNTWKSIVKDTLIDEDAWWGIRKRLDLEVPEASIAAALSCSGLHPAAQRGRRQGRAAFGSGEDQQEGWLLAADSSPDLAAVIRGLSLQDAIHRRASFEQAVQGLSALPCPWLRGGLSSAVANLSSASQNDADLQWRVQALKESLSCAPGRVPLLLHAPATGLGFVLELRVAPKHEGLPEKSNALLLPAAQEGVRSGFHAATSLSVSGQPRIPIESHSVKVLGIPEVLGKLRGIDGESLALPAALAFLSLWCEKPLPSDLACTGALRETDSGFAVAPVNASSLSAKARALAAWSEGAAVRMLVPDQGAFVVPADVRAVAVASFPDAVLAAGLEPSSVSGGWNAYGGEAERVSALEVMMRDLQSQNVERYRLPGWDPWMLLAERMRALIDSLETADSSSSRQVARRARPLMVLSFTHAGDHDTARRLLTGIHAEESMSPPVAVLAEIARVSEAIDAERWDDMERILERLEAELDELRSDEREALLGLARSAQGRAWLHMPGADRETKLSKAVELLEEAVAHHRLHQPHEEARTRIYLAMALRAEGRMQDAARQLAEAESALREHTARWSGSYHRRTRLFLLYERARVKVVSAIPETMPAALAAADEAMAAAEEAGGFWPLFGVLRVRAWALSAAGRPQEAAAVTTRMRQLLDTVPDPSKPLCVRILAEAEAAPTANGEVY